MKGIDFQQELNNIRENKNAYYFIGILSKFILDESLFNDDELHTFLKKELKFKDLECFSSDRTSIIGFLAKYLLQKYNENMSTILFNHILKKSQLIEINNKPISKKRKTKKAKSAFILIDKIKEVSHEDIFRNY